MNSPAENFATPRVAAGALFVDGSRVLLVRKTYGNGWDIPGGYVDRGESPADACSREIWEEIGLERSATRLLVLDWAPNDSDGDKILFVFSCGSLGDDEDRIEVDGQEIDHWEWVSVDRVSEYVIPRLARRISAAYTADRAGDTRYLEHGEIALTDSGGCPDGLDVVAGQ